MLARTPRRLHHLLCIQPSCVCVCVKYSDVAIRTKDIICHDKPMTVKPRPDIEAALCQFNVSMLWPRGGRGEPPSCETLVRFGRLKPDAVDVREVQSGLNIKVHISDTDTCLQHGTARLF